MGWILVTGLSLIGMLCWRSHPVDREDDDGTTIQKSFRTQRENVIIRSQSSQSQTQPHPQPTPLPSYQCPPQFQPLDDANADEPAVYAAALRALRAPGAVQRFVTDVHHNRSSVTYDGWGVPFQSVQDGMAAWKRRRIKELLQQQEQQQQHDSLSPEHLTIYESAAGVGMNLFQTVQLLRHEFGYTGDITVYGNDFSADAVALAKQLYHAGLYQHDGDSHTHWGVMCASDSRDLSHVPSRAFDLVLTGYITPLQDPLDTHDADWIQHMVQDVCPDAVAVARMQAIQEEWYDAWVRELIRLAKPGAPVWIEQVSPAFCDVLGDWGGVTRDFWTRRAASDTWDVEEDVVDLMDDMYINEGRYHVALQKKAYDS